MNEKKKMPVANIAPFGLRMQPDLKARIEKSARDNNRSMNAEIVDRLERSFEFDQDVARDDKIFIQMQQDQRFLTNKVASLEEKNKVESDFLDRYTSALNNLVDRRSNAVYVVLDAEGLPISWDEIMTHLGEIRKNLGSDIEGIEARILHPNMQSNDVREKFWFDLIKYYKTRNGRPKEGKTDEHKK